MADILTLVFRTFIPQTGTSKALKISPSSSTCSTLVVGERSINRSLLLLAAVTAASELGLKVLFFTQTQIQSLPGSLQHCMSNFSPDHLKKIKFAYPRTMEELLQEVACQHESSAVSAVPPSLLIVDGLEGYLRIGAGMTSGFQQGQQSSAAFISALLYDTAAFLTQSLEQKATEVGPAPCRVITSFQSEWEGHPGGEPSAPDPILSVLDRYFQVRCTLDRDNSSGFSGAGLQDVWHVYLSGTGITEAICAAEGQEEEEKDPRLAREWRLVIRLNGSMEFTVV